MAYGLEEVAKLPRKKVKNRPHDGSVEDTLYIFINADIDYARINDFEHRHANSNNLRKTFANRIKEEGLEDHVSVTIRGDEVFLIRHWGYEVEK